VFDSTRPKMFNHHRSCGFRNNLNTANLRGRAVLCASQHNERGARCNALWPQMLLAVATEDVRLYTLFLPLEP